MKLPNKQRKTNRHKHYEISFKRGLSAYDRHNLCLDLQKGQ